MAALSLSPAISYWSFRMSRFMCRCFQEAFLNASNWVKHPLLFTLQLQWSICHSQTSLCLSPSSAPCPYSLLSIAGMLPLFASHSFRLSSDVTSSREPSLIPWLGWESFCGPPKPPVHSSYIRVPDAAVLHDGKFREGNHVFSSSTDHQTVSERVGGRGVRAREPLQEVAEVSALEIPRPGRASDPAVGLFQGGDHGLGGRRLPPRTDHVDTTPISGSVWDHERKDSHRRMIKQDLPARSALRGASRTAWLLVSGEGQVGTMTNWRDESCQLLAQRSPSSRRCSWTQAGSGWPVVRGSLSS